MTATQRKLLTQFDSVDWDKPRMPGVELFLKYISKRTIERYIEQRVQSLLDMRKPYIRREECALRARQIMLTQIAQQSAQAQPQLTLFGS